MTMIAKVVQKFKRRPVPRNLQGLRGCRISFSQFGAALFLTPC